MSISKHRILEDEDGYWCSTYEIEFSVIWEHNPICDRPEYCPFCGEILEEGLLELRNRE